MDSGRKSAHAVYLDFLSQQVNTAINDNLPLTQAVYHNSVLLMQGISANL